MRRSGFKRSTLLNVIPDVELQVFHMLVHPSRELVLLASVEDHHRWETKSSRERSFIQLNNKNMHFFFRLLVDQNGSNHSTPLGFYYQQWCRVSAEGQEEGTDMKMCHSMLPSCLHTLSVKKKAIITIYLNGILQRIKALIWLGNYCRKTHTSIIFGSIVYHWSNEMNIWLLHSIV